MDIRNIIYDRVLHKRLGEELDALGSEKTQLEKWHDDLVFREGSDVKLYRGRGLTVNSSVDINDKTYPVTVQMNGGASSEGEMSVVDNLVAALRAYVPHQEVLEFAAAHDYEPECHYSFQNISPTGEQVLRSVESRLGRHVTPLDEEDDPVFVLPEGLHSPVKSQWRHKRADEEPNSILGPATYHKLTKRFGLSSCDNHIDWDAVRCYDELRAEVLDTRTIDGKPVNLEGVFSYAFKDDREREYSIAQEIYRRFGDSWEAVKYKRMFEGRNQFDKDIQLTYLPHGDPSVNQPLLSLKKQGGFNSEDKIAEFRNAWEELIGFLNATRAKVPT